MAKSIIDAFIFSIVFLVLTMNVLCVSLYDVNAINALCKTKEPDEVLEKEDTEDGIVWISYRQ